MFSGFLNAPNGTVLNIIKTFKVIPQSSKVYTKPCYPLKVLFLFFIKKFI